MLRPCGLYGEIEVDGDKITVVFPEEEQEKSRLAIEGKRIHFYKIRDIAQQLEPRLNGIPLKLEKYKAYKSYLKPPSKVGKKS